MKQRGIEFLGYFLTTQNWKQLTKNSSPKGIGRADHKAHKTEFSNCSKIFLTLW